MKFKNKNIPGEELIYKGLSDISKGKFRSVEALLVFLASPRLNELGFSIPPFSFEPNLVLYEILSLKFDNEAHLQYNALQTRVNKFCSLYKPFADE